MKFRDYVNNLNDQLSQNPDLGDLDVIYSRDDEGNGYQSVDIECASVCEWDGDYGGDVMYQDWAKEEDREFNANAIVIN